MSSQQQSSQARQHKVPVMTEEKETKALQDFFLSPWEKAWKSSSGERLGSYWNWEALQGSGEAEGESGVPGVLGGAQGGTFNVPQGALCVRWLQGEEEVGGTDRLPHLQGGHEGGNFCRGYREYGPWVWPGGVLRGGALQSVQDPPRKVQLQTSTLSWQSLKWISSNLQYTGACQKLCLDGEIHSQWPGSSIWIYKWEHFWWKVIMEGC